MMTTICVGVDGTKASVSALRFAFEEARLRNATVRAVTAWAVEPVYGGYGVGMTAEDANEYARKARETQEKAIGEALSGDEEAPTIEREIVRCVGPAPAEVLVEHAKDCDLLVVGTAHKGIFKRAALGSTSSYCVRHSRVPVAVVPYAETSTALEGASDSAESVPA